MTSETAANERLFAKLFDLVKNGRNEEIKIMVQDSAPSDLVDHSAGITLLHLAASYNNVELIDFLLSSGHDIESKTISGVTPLLLAVTYRNYDAVKFLLDSNANVFASNKNNESALRLLLKTMKDVPANIFESLRDRFRRSRNDVENIVADCHAEAALLNNDSELMKRILVRDKREEKINCDGFLELAIEFVLVEMIGVLVQHGCKSQKRKTILMKYLSMTMTSYNANLESVKPIVGKLLDWGVINAAAIEPLRKIFREGKQEAVQMLIDCNIDTHVRTAFDIDFLTQIFYNSNLDVNELLKNGLDVDEQDVDGYSLLHLAVIFKPMSFVRQLLHMGADPNIENGDGKTALFYASEPECMELLLQSGADVEVIDHEGNSMVKKTRDESNLLDIVIGHLVDQETIRTEILAEVNGDEQVRKTFNDSYLHLSCLKEVSICKENTLYALFKATDDELMCFPIDHEFVSGILNVVREHHFNSYFVSKLERNLTRALEFHAMIFNIAATLAEVMGVCDSNHLVIEKIVGYLGTKDILTCVLFSK